MSEVAVEQQELTTGLRRLFRSASLLSIVAWPTVLAYLWQVNNWTFVKSALVAGLVVIIFMGMMELFFRKTLPWPSLFETESTALKEDDITNRRRFWFWRFWFKMFVYYSILVSILTITRGGPWMHQFTHILPAMAHGVTNPALLVQTLTVVGLFAVNFLIFMGPLLLMGISQIKTYEPGDASWGVKLEDVRGQKEAKEEVRRVVEIWQSGDAFEKAGGKRERGLLFLGPPGVGKTMMAKAIATGFNAPFVTIPGSGFAQTFIGIDAVIVRLLNRRAKKVARKWGGQCIIFVDEIDAVGRSRSSGGGGGGMGPGGMFGGMMGGQLALNQILVCMDSIDAPPGMKMWYTKKINTLLDAIFIVPRRIKGKRLRLPSPAPRKDQVFWVGATNADLEFLDSALTRPGRMGRHVWFRNPTKEDRKDIFDLYIGKVQHEDDLDRPERRDELAQVTQGSSPARIEQMCSMALLTAQHDGRTVFNWDDMMTALVTLEAGSDIGQEQIPAELRATAIHEAGHAAAAHIYRPERESTRLSIKMRGQTLGHHQSFNKEERHGAFRKEEIAELIHDLAAMAAELVFYNDTTSGVYGDLHMASHQASYMSGSVGMGLPIVSVYEEDNKEYKDTMKKFAKIGRRLLTSDYVGDSQAKNDQAAVLLGYTFVVAWNFAKANKDGIERVAEVLLEKREIFGNELVELLDEQHFTEFLCDNIDYFIGTDVWPPL